MKKINYLLILDRSGSMSSIREQTIAGVNRQFDEIRKVQSEQPDDLINVSLMLFDTNPHPYVSCDYVFVDKPAVEIKPITYNDFVPRGGTPLNDAIANGVKKIQDIMGTGADDPNISVLVTIFTDGEENSSKEFTREQIMQMIEELSKKDEKGFQKWAFAFVGAGGIAEVQATAASYGISKLMTMAYDGSARGAEVAFQKIGSGTSCYMTRSLVGEAAPANENFFESQV